MIQSVVCVYIISVVILSHRGRSCFKLHGLSVVYLDDFSHLLFQEIGLEMRVGHVGAYHIFAISVGFDAKFEQNVLDW